MSNDRPANPAVPGENIELQRSDAPLDTEALAQLNQLVTEQVNAYGAALDAALVDQIRLNFASQILEALQTHPQLHSVSLMDWQEEAGEGEPFDLTLDEGFDESGEVLIDLDNGAEVVPDAVVLDDLRFGSQAGEHAGRLNVSAVLAWLRLSIESMNQQPQQD